MIVHPSLQGSMHRRAEKQGTQLGMKRGACKILWVEVDCRGHVHPVPLAVQLSLCLALVAWSHGQQMQKPTANSIDEQQESGEPSKLPSQGGW